MRSSGFFILTLLAAVSVPLVGQEMAELKAASQLEAEASLEELERVEVELQDSLAEVWARKRVLEDRSAKRELGMRGDEEEIRIVNGVLTFDFPTTGALIKGNSRASASSHCSGTLIGCKTFLTANHCVEGERTPDRYFVYLQQAGIYSVDEISAEDVAYDFPHADYAVLRLGEQVEGVRPTPLNSQVIGSGTRAEIVGFGRSGGFNQDYGLKRAGRVETAACDGRETSLLCWDFQAPVGLPGEDSNTCNADSGGPLFVDSPTGPVVAGITSGGSRSTCLQGDHSYDVDVRQFLDKIEGFGGVDLDDPSCGDLPVVGSSQVQVFGDSQVLGGFAGMDYQVDLPAGLARLRLALNGQDELGTDFDLLVNHGSLAEPGSSDCEEDGSSNYGFCDFESPEGGSWFIRVRQKGSRAGTFQVIATVIQGVP